MSRDESFWIASTEATEYPALTEPTTVDVAVVGGGIAGICTAWELAGTGRSVAVLEADRILTGVTGNTTAKLTALHTMIYAELAESAGEEAAECYGRTQAEAVGHVARLVTDLGIECDLERLPAFTYTEDPDQVPALQAEADAAVAADLPASFVTETSLPFPVAGAVRVERQAQFHPRRYLLALAQALVVAGGRIFEQSRVVDLKEGKPCRLTLENGVRVTAADVVIATHYPVFDPSLLFTRLTVHRELVVAAPIAPEADPQGMYITQDGGTRSVRTTPYSDGRRLLIVTGESFTPGSADVAERYARLEDWMRQRFGVTETAYRWAAQDNRTADRIPFIGRLHAHAEHAYVATGFGGWGMSNGVVAGQLLGALINGQRPDWADVYDPTHRHPLGPVLKAQGDVAKHFVGDRLHAPETTSVDDLAPGAGTIMRIGGKRRAVYRAPDGTVSVLSATCTHLGCVVAFNDAEKAWECPCHGSRFGVDGEVLHGPANQPLERYELPDDTAAEL